MIYRIHALIACNQLPSLDKLRDELRQIQSIAITINPGQDNPEPSTILLERCYHDDPIPKPCEQLYSWQSS